VAEHRHKRETAARSKPRAATVAASFALLSTAAVVAVGVAASDPSPGSLLADGAASVSGPVERDAADVPVSRSSLDSRAERRRLQDAFDRNEKKTATLLAVRRADSRLWTTTDLNLWNAADDGADQVGELTAGKRVLVTGRKLADRTEVVVDGRSRWVTAGYLSDEKPVVAAGGLSMQPCPDPGVESGLTDNAVYVYRSVCHAFPQITSYGGWDAHGEHSSGRALDIMTSDKALGDQIAVFLQSHASELNLFDVIWWDRIWTPVRASEGWRYYGDHGSATANHMDHVHVSTY
jgi:hypothetical protein